MAKFLNPRIQSLRTSKKKYEHYPDSELQSLISTGNESAFKEIFERKQAFIYNYALGVTRSCDLAEEIVQDIFIKLWTNREKMIDIQYLDAYLNRATRNQSYSVLRKISAEALRIVSLSECIIADDLSAESTTLYNDSVKLLKTVVDKLPPQRKLVYELCHEQGYTYDEVASRLNISSGTVHKHMKLALKTIRSYFVHLDKLIALLILLNR